MGKRKKKNMNFKTLPSKLNIPEVEEKVLDYWETHDILQKYLDKNKDTTKRFSFIDGPITANNPMGVHHARGRALKDLVQRFKNMQGFKQRFQNGFDCQGLWVEVEVEKSLGFDSKKDIEDYGLGKFTQACKERVRRFAKKITEQSKRLGYFMDWDNSYFTMSENNNLHIWSFLKKCQEKGLIYKSHSVTAWCPRCETGLSKHEQADGYKTITEDSVYVKFPIKERDNEYLLVWTTTPWTLPANVLLAINPDLEYVGVEREGEVYYLGKKAAEHLGFDDGHEVDSNDLLGLNYTPPYPNIEAQKEVKHFVTNWRLVDEEEGTGIVHIAPGCGEDDFDLGKALESPVLSPIDEAGIFKEGYGDLTGMHAHKVKDKVIEHLKKKRLFYKLEHVTHSYPHCWRCKTKTLFRLEENWFIDCQKIKEDLKKAAEAVNWMPFYVGKRMEDWLENMGDWMISRRRFYGLALPFYECKECGELTVVGSKEELKSLAVNPGKVDGLPSLHRPWIDKVEIKCPHCGNIVQRVPEVGDCWLDAGVVPFSTLHYLEDKNYWKKWFPARFISEMIEQVRLWYYSMLVYGVILENKAPYQNVLSYDAVRDEKGEKMSKSKGNGIPYDEAVENIGADVMRWLYFKKNPSAPVRFGYELARKVKRGFFFTLWNSFRFFLGFASIELDEKDAEKIEKKESENVLDQWILARLYSTEKIVTEALEKYDPVSASTSIEDFVVKDLSLWYIRRSRGRIGPQAEDREDKLDAYATFLFVLRTVCKMLAPFVPFMAEKLWYRVGEGDSVHLEDWPTIERKHKNEALEEKMEKTRKICSVGHSLRRKAGIKTRQPLEMVQIRGPLKREEGLVRLIKEELNVKKVFFVGEINLGEGEEKNNWVQDEEDKFAVALRTLITPELRKEGVCRETMRKIQYLRKKAKLNPSQKIEVYFWGDEKLGKMIGGCREEIKKETISLKVEKVFSKPEGLTEGGELEIEDEKLHVGIRTA